MENGKNGGRRMQPAAYGSPQAGCFPLLQKLINRVILKKSRRQTKIYNRLS